MLPPKKKALKRALENAEESTGKKLMDSEYNEGADAPSFMEQSPKNPIEFKGTYYSPDKMYKTKVKKRYGEDEVSKEKRTFRGVVSKAPKPNRRKQEGQNNNIYKA